MIDWHSHILPAVDDGSKDIKESLALLRLLANQGCDICIATPHFFANDETVDKFLERRQTAFESIQPVLFKKAPRIYLGAEVKYYNGISRMQDLEKLKIQNTKNLLLEMPFSKWTEYTLRELDELSRTKSFKIVLAHIERYLNFQNADTFERLLENGILMQANAGFFNGFSTRRKAVSMLGNSQIHFIGSDCHNNSSRQPQIGSAYKIIEKKLGTEFVNQFNEYGHSVLL